MTDNECFRYFRFVSIHTQLVWMAVTYFELLAVPLLTAGPPMSIWEAAEMFASLSMVDVESTRAMWCCRIGVQLASFVLRWVAVAMGAAAFAGMTFVSHLKLRPGAQHLYALARFCSDKLGMKVYTYQSLSHPK
jgi:hypothetical protein